MKNIQAGLDMLEKAHEEERCPGLSQLKGSVRKKIPSTFNKEYDINEENE